MGRNHNADLKDVWQTPSEILTLLEAGDSPSITTDPCAGMNTAIGETYNYTVDDDGLTKPWVGKTFVNPPFSNKTAWLQKAVDEHTTSRDFSTPSVIYVLTPDSTDTKSWWHTYIAPFATYVWFSEGRVSFIDPETNEKAGSPTFGTAISIYGDPHDDVKTALQQNGWLTKTVTTD